MAFLNEQIYQGNCEVTDISNGTIYCHPTPDKAALESGYFDGWHNMLAEINGNKNEHIRLSIDWPKVASDNSADDLLKSWGITEWYPKNLTQFPTCFFYISTDLKEWKKIDNVCVEDGNIIVEFDLPQERAYISSTLLYTYSRYQELLNDVKSSEYVEIIKMCECSFGDTMYLFKITDTSVDDSVKKHIYLEAALHCAETTGCFIADYLIRYLASGDKDAKALLQNYVFHIIPIVDLSGLRLGLESGTCKNEHKNMNRDFGTFANDETKSIWNYIKNLNDKNPNIIAIDFHGGWPGVTDNENNTVSWVGVSGNYTRQKNDLLIDVAKHLLSPDCSFLPPPHCFSRPDDEKLSHYESNPTTMVGYLTERDIPAILIELSYTNSYDGETDKILQLSQALLERSAKRIPHALDKAFKKHELSK